MTRLSVNINKIATLRNARGGNIPNIVESAINCQKFGAQGITVHPRPDERHIRYNDVHELRPVVTTEFNIEGYPNRKFIDLVCEVIPEQVTLVPDPPEAITSNAGWDTLKNKSFLIDVIKEFHSKGIRVSIFTGTETEMIEGAKRCNTDRIELYTEPYATNFPLSAEKAAQPFVTAALKAKELGLGVNAGHDLNLDNLKPLIEKIPFIDEVSIGHALIADALYMGLETTIQKYLEALK
ncbi:MAG: pyridoxine 5'-phosphate synthase [Prolixibacteraceae bacterium]|nr:pyridoxine 5'-phosphate synthase [Prolixibacteraceae bacterium]MBN2649956.1 pyridoxine 5'-phosphate synthase [Prolixibacteraceae bacterium]